MLSLLAPTDYRQQLGRCVMSPCCQRALDACAASTLLTAHAAGNWGTISHDESAANTQALVCGRGSLTSAHRTPDRHGTTQLVIMVTQYIESDEQRCTTMCLEADRWLLDDPAIWSFIFDETPQALPVTEVPSEGDRACAAIASVVIRGSGTYAVRDQLRALGGRWYPPKKAWLLPSEHAAEARRLVAGASQASDRAPRGPGARRAGRSARVSRPTEKQFLDRDFDVGDHVEDTDVPGETWKIKRVDIVNVYDPATKAWGKGRLATAVRLTKKSRVK